MIPLNIRRYQGFIAVALSYGSAAGESQAEPTRPIRLTVLAADAAEGDSVRPQASGGLR